MNDLLEKGLKENLVSFDADLWLFDQCFGQVAGQEAVIGVEQRDGMASAESMAALIVWRRL